MYRTLIVKGWWAILLVLLAAAVLLGRHAPDIEVDASTDVLLDEDDDDLTYYEDSREAWGSDEYAIVFLTREGWIDAEGVARLRRIVAALRDAPHVESVTSVLDVPLLRQEPGPAINPAAIPTLAAGEVDFVRAREELLGHTQAVGNLITADGRSVALLAYFQGGPDGDSRRRAMVAAIRELAASWAPDLAEPVRLSGTPIIHVNILEHLEHDLAVFGLASLLLFTLGFALAYRRPRFVILPIVSCLLPVLLILGAMCLLGMTLTVITANLPVLLFTLLLPYTVYFVEAWLERRAAQPDEPGADASARAAGRVWLPCLFSCATTMAAFAALATSGTVPVHDFGLMMSVGMGIGLVVVFLAIPSLARPLPPLAVAPPAPSSGSHRVVALFAAPSLRRPGLVVLAAAALLLAAVWGASRLSSQSNVTQYFREGTPVRVGLETIDRELGGTTPLEVTLTSKESGFFLKPEGLAALRAAQRYFEDLPEAGSVRSLATLVDELRKKSPQVERLMPILGRHPLVRSVTAEFSDAEYATSRVIVRMRETAPSLDRRVVLDGLQAHLDAQPELAELEVRTTGVFLLYANMLESLMRTQRETFLWVIAAIFLMLLVLFRSFVLALVVVLTQTLPALVTLGFMGWLGIPLDLVTVMIASIAMGVGIDASIQYACRFRHERAGGASLEAAIVQTHATTGRAIWIATTVIIAGFCVLTLSDFRPSIYLGLLTAVAMLMSQVAALTVLPAILRLIGRPR